MCKAISHKKCDCDAEVLITAETPPEVNVQNATFSTDCLVTNLGERVQLQLSLLAGVEDARCH